MIVTMTGFCMVGGVLNVGGYMGSVIMALAAGIFGWLLSELLKKAGVSPWLILVLGLAGICGAVLW